MVGCARLPGRILGDDKDPVDNAREVPHKLPQQSPEHLPRRSLMDKDGKERQEKTKDDQQNLSHPPSLPPLQAPGIATLLKKPENVSLRVPPTPEQEAAKPAHKYFRARQVTPPELS